MLYKESHQKEPAKQMVDKGKKHRGSDSKHHESDQAHGYNETPANLRLKATILQVIENQIRDNDPPETRQTLERLLGKGYARQQAIEMIGSALAEEIWTMLHNNKLFDQARFATLLERLD